VEVVNLSGSQALVASSTSVNLGNVSLGNSASGTVSLVNTGSSPIKVTQLSVTGQSFSVAGQPSLPLSVAAGNTYNLTINFKPAAEGPASGQLEIATAANTKSSISINLLGMGTGPVTFGYNGSPLQNTLVPPQPASPISSDFFGMTIEHTFTPFPSFPVSTMRFWDVDPWNTVEPSSGQFVWTGMDTSINIGKENGVGDFIYTFGNVPAWASTVPSASCPGRAAGSCASPDLAAFDDFTTQLVQRYCGTIKYYETWNEPNDASTWKGTNTQLLAVAQHLYQIAKDPANCGCANGVCAPNGGANPNHVLTPTISRITQSNLNWLDSYLGQTGAQYPYADVASFHGYGPTNPEDIVTEVQSLNQVLAKHGLSNLELWDTEADWGETTTVGHQQASWLIRYHMALATTGVSRFLWYAYDNCSWGTLWEGYCPSPQMPVEHATEGGEAYGVIESWLSGATLASCQQYENGLWSCELQRPGGYDAWMLWSSTGTQITIPIPEGSGLTVYRDWQNNVDTLPASLTVDEMPVLVENVDL
jgi:hypothetical protein